MVIFLMWNEVAILTKLALSPAIRVVITLSCINLNFGLAKLNYRWHWSTDESIHIANIYCDMINYSWIKFRWTILANRTQDFDSIGISGFLRSDTLNCVRDHSGYGFNQLETTSQCDIICHRRSPYQYDPCTSHQVACLAALSRRYFCPLTGHP